MTAGPAFDRMMVLPMDTQRADARILVVDDDRPNVELLARILEPEGYRNVEAVTDPRSAVSRCTEQAPDLILLDLRMPHVDGLEVIQTLRTGLAPQDFPAIIVLTSDNSRQAKQQALASGAFDFIAKPLSPYEVRMRVANAIDHHLLQRALVRQNEALEQMVEVRTEELEDARVQILERLAIAAEYHDPETAAHTRRVGELSSRIARQMGMSRREVELVRRAAPLHDVGKIGISADLLRKTGPLSEDEFEQVKVHTTIGGRILSGSRIELLDMAAGIALFHHERWGGGGYPAGASGESIPLEARIVSLADVFDSLTHVRSYKEAWSVFDTLKEIERQSGDKFEPAVVKAFLNVYLEGLE
ncbi:MAG: HD domain-containing phosphohydrolase [Gemmatimonadota bacterium]